MDKSEIQVKINQYEKPGYSEIVFIYKMDLDLWKKTFSENIKIIQEQARRDTMEFILKMTFPHHTKTGYYSEEVKERWLKEISEEKKGD